uniref:RNB domain-containing protein n=1 Tax=Heterorhabditis bacteriophora TaxID=37862 RepID=A0A1I7XSG4_HETBA
MARVSLGKRKRSSIAKSNRRVTSNSVVKKANSGTIRKKGNVEESNYERKYILVDAPLDDDNNDNDDDDDDYDYDFVINEMSDITPHGSKHTRMEVVGNDTDIEQPSISTANPTPKYWNPQFLYRLSADITLATIRENGSEGVGRIEIGQRLAMDTTTKPGNRRVSSFIVNVCSDNKDHIGTLRISDVTLRRLNDLLDIVTQQPVVVTIHRVIKIINERENAAGYQFQIDKKSLMKCMKALEKEGLLHVYDKTIVTDSVMNKVQLMCHRDIPEESPEVERAIRQTIDEYHREGRVFPHGQLRCGLINIYLFSESRSKIFQVSMIYILNMNIVVILVLFFYSILFYFKTSHAKEGRIVSHRQSLDIRRKLFAVWQYMKSYSNLFMDIPLGQNLTFTTRVGLCCKILFMRCLCQHLYCVYTLEKMCQLVTFSLQHFLNIHYANTSFQRELIHLFLNDPIKRHICIGDLPHELRFPITKDKKVYRQLEHILLTLSAFGLMAIGKNPDPMRFTSAHSSVFFVCKKAILYDTSTSQRGYASVTPPISRYDKYVYEFNNQDDVAFYWHHLRAIVQSTPLSFRNDVNSEEISQNRHKKYSAGLFDKSNVMVPVDQSIDLLYPLEPHEGCAGFDSALYIVANLQKDWNSYVRSLMPSDVELTKKKKIKELKRKKRPLDSVDIVSEQSRVHVRSRFSPKEKDMLILIRAVGFFLNPVYRFWLDPTVLRDIMHEYVPESRSKTVQCLMAAGVREMVRPNRLAYLQRIVRNLSTFQEMRDLRFQLASSPLSTAEGKTMFFKNAFDIANRLLFMEYQTIPHVLTSNQQFESYLNAGKSILIHTTDGAFSETILDQISATVIHNALQSDLEVSVDEEILSVFEQAVLEQQSTKQIRYLESADLRLEEVHVFQGASDSFPRLPSFTELVTLIDRSQPADRYPPVPFEDFILSIPVSERQKLRTIHQVINQTGAYGASVEDIARNTKMTRDMIWPLLKQLIDECQVVHI